MGTRKTAVNTLHENAHRNQQTTDHKLDSMLATLQGKTLPSPAALEPIAPLIPEKSEGFEETVDVIDVDNDESSSSSAPMIPSKMDAKPLDIPSPPTEPASAKASNSSTEALNSSTGSTVERLEGIGATGFADDNGDMVMLAPTVSSTPLLHKVGDKVWNILGTGSSARGHQAKVNSIVETPGMEGYVVQGEKPGAGPTFISPACVANDEEGMRALLAEAETPHVKRVSPRLANQRNGPY